MLSLCSSGLAQRDGKVNNSPTKQALGDGLDQAKDTVRTSRAGEKIGSEVEVEFRTYPNARFHIGGRFCRLGGD